MSNYEIMMYHLAVCTLIVYTVQAILMLCTLFALLFIAFYPNSEFAKMRRAKNRASELLFKQFRIFNPDKIRYEASSNTLNEEDILVYEILRRSRWTEGSSQIGKNASQDGSLLPHFEVKLSSEYFHEEHKRINSFYRNDKKSRDKHFKKLSKDLRDKISYLNGEKFKFFK